MAALVLPEVLTMAQASATLEQLRTGLGADGELVVDASRLAELDSAALAVLLELRRLALSAGRSLRLSAPPAKLGALAGLYGVQELLGLDAPAA